MNSQYSLKSSIKNFLIAVLTSVSFAACSSSGPGDVLFYVALGDSLSVGWQPDASGEGMETDQGYPDIIYASLVQQFPNLQLVKLGCPGETTASMVSGGICDDYDTGSQLDDALEFLVENQDKILLVTIDIGANDVFGSECVDRLQTLPPPTEEEVAACFTPVFQAAGSNLGLIASGLFSAADGKFPIIGMNYYNPFLNAWLFPLTPEGMALPFPVAQAIGQGLAVASAELQVTFNTQVLGAVYGLNGFPVADVAAAFNSLDFMTQVPFPLPPPFDMLPLNVATICQLTYQCAPPPQGPDIHANAMGYQAIAQVFLAVFNAL